MSNMTVDLAGIRLKNPIITASGTSGSPHKLVGLCDLNAIGAITIKGIAPTAWPGNPQPRMWECASGIMNCIGLQNPGVDAFLEAEEAHLTKISEITPIFVNVAGHECDDFVAVVKALNDKPWVSAFELNVSCPNLASGGSALGKDPHVAAAITNAVKSVSTKPVIVKLTPDSDVVAVGKACEQAGADIISLINTIPAMAIDPYTKKSRLARDLAGLSGPAIKPVALRMVWQLAQQVSTPIIGMGGISSGLDAAEFILAGAHAVSIGTQTLIEPAACNRIVLELTAWVDEMGASSIADLTGGYIPCTR